MGSGTAPPAAAAAAPSPTADALRRRERGENFPVALRVLPARVRTDLHAVYAFARAVDDIGDDFALTVQTRLARLDRVEGDVRAAAAGERVASAAVAAVVPLLQSGRVGTAPFLDLVAANRVDQSTRRYASYDDLLAYCAMSANPVGRLVLPVFGIDDDTARRLSDDVCTALQILEHCQDVAEDKRDRDRIYLPQDDLRQFGVTDDDLDAPTASGPVRAVVAMEVERAARLLDSGTALVALLRGHARLAVAAYVAGGRATVDALRRARFEVLSGPPRPRRRDLLRHLLALLLGRR